VITPVQATGLSGGKTEPSVPDAPLSISLARFGRSPPPTKGDSTPHVAPSRPSTKTFKGYPLPPTPPQEKPDQGGPRRRAFYPRTVQNRRPISSDLSPLPIEPTGLPTKLATESAGTIVFPCRLFAKKVTQSDYH